MSRERGFTLIEIMIVVAIIGILAAFIIPNIMGYKDNVVEKYKIIDSMYVGMNKINKVCWDGQVFLVDPEGEITDLKESCSNETAKLAKPASPKITKKRVIEAENEKESFSGNIDDAGHISYE